MKRNNIYKNLQYIAVVKFVQYSYTVHKILCGILRYGNTCLLALRCRNWEFRIQPEYNKICKYNVANVASWERII